MPTLNVSIPIQRVVVRSGFLHDFREDGDWIDGTAHAIALLPARCLCFHVLLDNGAHIGRLPIHALAWKVPDKPVPEDEPWRVQLWDVFSYDGAVTEYDYLSGMRCRAMLSDGSASGGNYLFTVDYFGTQQSEMAGDLGWKCHHVLALDNGWLAALPNNRLCFAEPAVTRPFDKPPTYKTISRTWRTEQGAKWRSSDDDRMYFDILPADANL